MILNDTMTLEFSADAGTDVEFFASSRTSQGALRYDLASAGVSASTAAVEIVGAPAPGETREILSVHLRNSGASSRAITVRVDVDGTDREVRVVTLLTHESLDYAAGSGWTHYGADGEAHVSGVAVSSTISGTLAVSGAATLGSAVVTAGATVGTTLAVAGAATLASAVITAGATVGTTLAVAGDVSAAGGFRRDLVFAAPGAAGAVAAAQTNLDLRLAHDVPASGYVAKRPGSIMGLSAQLSAAVTGASGAVTVKCTVNGTEVGAALDVAFTTVGATVTGYAVAAKDAVPFAAGDVIGVSYTSHAGVSNTPGLVASIEIEC